MSTGSLGQKGLAFLHEPDGMPYREESARPVGSADREAVYQVDGRDVVAGTYEVVAVAPASQPLAVNAKVIHSPLLAATRRGTAPARSATLTNVAPTPVTAEVAMLLGGGAERVETRGRPRLGGRGAFPSSLRPGPRRWWSI